MNKSKALAGARRRGWERQYYVDHSDSASTTRTTRAFGLTMDTEYLYECGRTQTDKLDDCSVSSAASSYNAYIRKLHKETGEVIWTRIYNGDNQDGVSGILDMNVNTFYSVVENESMLFLIGQSTKGFILRIRKTDGYIEEAIIPASSIYPYQGILFSVYKDKLIIITHIMNDTSINVTFYDKNDFTSSSSNIYSGEISYGVSYNYELIIANDEMVLIESTNQSSSYDYWVRFYRWDIDSSYNLSNFNGGKLTHFSSAQVTSGSKTLLSTHIQNDGYIYQVVSDVNGNNANQIVKMQIPSSGDVVDYLWCDSPSNEIPLSIRLIGIDSGYLYAYIDIDSAFTAFGYSLPSNTSRGTLVVQYSMHTMKLNSIISEMPISKYSSDISDVWGAISVLGDAMYLAGRTNGNFKRYRGNDTPPTSTWEEPVLIKLPLS